MKLQPHLGHDVSEKKAETRWGLIFFESLSRDQITLTLRATYFSPKNLLYMEIFIVFITKFLKLLCNLLSKYGTRYFRYQGNITCIRLINVLTSRLILCFIHVKL